MRLAILGNSGSGKTTLARWAARVTGAAVLDLDSVAWEADRPAVPRSESEARADVLRFCRENGDWVAEGCYANLMEVALEFQPRLILLDPGEAQCLANCRARPWEPHKYRSKEEQDRNLAFLLSWVSEYYTRDGPLSLREHTRRFARYDGPKLELRELPRFDPPSPELLALLR
jgi:adenylate kinase family enzyme